MPAELFRTADLVFRPMRAGEQLATEANAKHGLVGRREVAHQREQRRKVGRIRVVERILSASKDNDRLMPLCSCGQALSTMRVADIDRRACFLKRPADLAQAGFVIVLDDKDAHPAKSRGDTCPARVTMRRTELKGREGMPLQNRIDPFGEIHAVPERGLFMGNRGIIHDPETKTLLKKRWALQAWIICVCAFKGKKRDPMGRNRPGGKAGWTELFFLDEVTALSAGHRPCFYCQQERAKDFAGRFGDAFGIADPKAPEIDKRLHKERLASGGPLIAVDRAMFDTLPDGAMVFYGDRPFAKRGRKLRAWTFWGYGDAWDFFDFEFDVWLLTPPTTVEILRQGYKPIWHPSIKTEPTEEALRARRPK